MGLRGSGETRSAVPTLENQIGQISRAEGDGQAPAGPAGEMAKQAEARGTVYPRDIPDSQKNLGQTGVIGGQ